MLSLECRWTNPHRYTRFHQTKPLLRHVQGEEEIEKAVCRNPLIKGAQPDMVMLQKLTCPLLELKEKRPEEISHAAFHFMTNKARILLV